MNGWGLGHKAGDSGSYLNTDLSFSKLGRRVPLYPLFLKICKRMVKWDVDMGCAIAGVIQHICSLLILILLFRILMAVTKKRLLSWIVVLFYGCNVAMLNWDSAIMTESFTLDAVIIFIYILIKYLNNKSALWGSVAVFESVIAAMIKPTCAVLTGVCLVLLVIQFVSEPAMRKKVCRIAVVLVLAILYYVGYCSLTYRHYGVFNLTQLAPRHGLVTCLVTETYKNYPDKELVAKIDAVLEDHRAQGLNIRRYQTTTEVMKLFGGYEDDKRTNNIRVTEFNKYCKKSNPMAHLKFKFNNIIDYWDTPYENTEWGLWDYAIEYSRAERVIYFIQKHIFSTLYIWCDFLMLFICIVMTVFKSIRYKEIPWYWLGMSGTMLILLYAVYGNAYASFYRHTLFLVPFVYISFGMFVSHIIDCIRGRVIQKK